MKIAIFHDAQNTEIAGNIGKLITDRGITLSFADSARVWDKGYCKSPVSLLDHVTHMVYILPAQGIVDDSTFPFLSGYCIGKEIRIILIETDYTRGACSIPENCRHFGILMKSEAFEDFLSNEYVRFSAEDRKIRARNALMDRGISCFEENFVFIVSSGDAEAVDLFLKAGFDPALRDSRGNSLLTLAVRAQVPAVASLLLDAGADVNLISGDRGYSPLMDAVQKGDLAMAEILLQKGADPNLRSKDGQTALIVAVGRGDEQMVRALLGYGANPDITDGLGMSAVKYASLFKNEGILELFNSRSA
jgi:hypothetical protein